MATTLIVEDGTIVANANSWNSLVEIKTFASLRARTLTIADPLIEGYAIRATDYLESFRDQYKGDQIDDAQFLSFPRTGVIVYGVTIADDEIPSLIRAAQNQLIIEQSLGVELQPTFVMAGRIKRRKTGPLETEWFDGAQTGIAPIIASVASLIDPLLRQTSALVTVRV